MIQLLRSGRYQLTETKHHIKILQLDKQTYAWIEPPTIGGVLVLSHHSHRVDTVLSMGEYALFDVDDEPELSDQLHLQLEVGIGAWQGYLLPTGFPDEKKIRSRIIPTHEVIMSSVDDKNAIQSVLRQRKGVKK